MFAFQFDLHYFFRTCFCRGTSKLDQKKVSNCYHQHTFMALSMIFSTFLDFGTLSQFFITFGIFSLLFWTSNTFPTFLYSSDSQPGCHGTQECREKLLGLPPNFGFHCNLLRFLVKSSIVYWLGCCFLVIFSAIWHFGSTEEYSLSTKFIWIIKLSSAISKHSGSLIDTMLPEQHCLMM